MNINTANRPPVIALMGPTASGKTALAMEIADRLPCDLISVDSAIIYRGMNIGTAKPDAAELARYPHALVDILDPDEAYSAEQFRRDALREIDHSHARGRIPLLVGGTMLYFRALMYGLSELPSADDNTRQAIEQRAKRLGWEALHRELAAIDPEAAARIHPNDPQRLQRALEVHSLTGRPLSALQTGIDDAGFDYALFKLVLWPADREVLHTRIAQRLGCMFACGLLNEVRDLRSKFVLDAAGPAMRCVGYRQAWQFLDGEIDYSSMIWETCVATRQLAKRQLTWLRRELESARVICNLEDRESALAELFSKLEVILESMNRPE